MGVKFFELTEEEAKKTPFINIQKQLLVLSGSGRDVEEFVVTKTRSNQVLKLQDYKNADIYIRQNQRLHSIFCNQLENCKITILDSVVVSTRSIIIQNCNNCEFTFEDVDIRRVAVYNTQNSRFICTHSPPVVDNYRFFWREGCENNIIQLSEFAEQTEDSFLNLKVVEEFPVPNSPTPTTLFASYFDDIEKLHSFIFEANGEATPEGKIFFEKLSPYIPENFHVLYSSEEISNFLSELEEEKFLLSEEEIEKAQDDERMEFEDSEDEIRVKVKELIKYLTPKSHTVFFTGAGVSTSADLPDYRGPQGVWTMQSKGKNSKMKNLTSSNPTFAHYAITELTRRKLIKFVVSTNMDCLHIRSGLPKHLISEQHGNCHREDCEDCHTPYYRQFDVGETVFDPRSHYTSRRCNWCKGKLEDTIIHFSEPVKEIDLMLATYHARKSNLSVVMGTSMNVQPAACYPDKCLRNKDGKLVIVNLQKTPYDQFCAIRIFAKTDTFMKILMEELGILQFDRSFDSLEQMDSWDKFKRIQNFIPAYIE